MAFPVKVDGGIRVRGWQITTHQDHILESRCGCRGDPAAVDADSTQPGPADEAARVGAPAVDEDDGTKSASFVCNFCRFSQELELPSLPEEVYASSFLRLQHTASSATLEVRST